MPAGLADLDEAVLLATILQRARHQAALDEVRRVVEDPQSTENDIQKVLGNQFWMFGGQYVKVGRRLLTIFDQIDIPLLRPDGSIHVVELKQANIPKLVVKYRNHLIPGPQVHEAVGQALNYLVALDEQRLYLSSALRIETRRAAATVVIGSPRYVTGGITRDLVADTLRTYSAGLSRVEVITYDDLLEAAQRSLRPDPDDELAAPESADD